MTPKVFQDVGEALPCPAVIELPLLQSHRHSRVSKTSLVVPTSKRQIRQFRKQDYDEKINKCRRRDSRVPGCEVRGMLRLGSATACRAVGLSH